jgi:hypothetical protein
VATFRAASAALAIRWTVPGPIAVFVGCHACQ